jgi:hypothetical protein
MDLYTMLNFNILLFSPDAGAKLTVHALRFWCFKVNVCRTFPKAVWTG